MRKTGLLAALSAALIACGGGQKPAVAVPPPVDVPAAQGSAAVVATTPTPAPTPPPTPASIPGPAGDRARSLREAADLLEQASAALLAGNHDRADFLFDSAEVITGPGALAEVAPIFRQGGPPVIETPLVKVADNGPAPMAVGDSDQEDAEAAAEAKLPPPKPERGSLEGDVTLDGKVPAGVLALVTLEPASGKWKPRHAKPRLMEQRDRQFAPRLLVIATGSTVTFPNFDKVFHNVFSTSDAASFDLGIYKEGDAREVTFNKEGIVHVGCNLHANMGATIVVVSAPHFLVADDSGHFVFKSVAPGKYKMKIWTERSKAPIEQDVTIKVGKNVVGVAASADAPAGPAPDKFGAPRG